MANPKYDDLEEKGAFNIGHNGGEGLTQDTWEKHVSAILRQRNGPVALAKAALKAAQKVEKDLKSDAKKDGIRLVQMEAVLKLREMDSEDEAGEIAADSVNYLRWSGLLEGEQGDLFAGLSDTPSEASERWFARGFKDLREGAIDPDGYGDGKPGPIMVGIKPSYVPVEFFTDWSNGAAEADAKNQADFLAKQEVKADTPVEEAAKGKKADKKKDKVESTPEEDETASVFNGSEFDEDSASFDAVH